MVVMDPLQLLLVIYVIPLEVNQVCSGGIETWLQVVLGLPTVFHQIVHIVTQDWYVVIPSLSFQDRERSNLHKT